METEYKESKSCSSHLHDNVVYCKSCGKKAVRTRFGDEFYYWCNFKGCRNEEMCSQTKIVEEHKVEMEEKFRL